MLGTTASGNDTVRDSPIQTESYFDLWEMATARFLIMGFLLHGFSVVFLRPSRTVKLYSSAPAVVKNCNFYPSGHVKLYFLSPKQWPKTLIKNLAKNLAKNLGMPTTY